MSFEIWSGLVPLRSSISADGRCSAPCTCVIELVGPLLAKMGAGWGYRRAVIAVADTYVPEGGFSVLVVFDNDSDEGAFSSSRPRLL